MTSVASKGYLIYVRNFIFGVEDSLVSTVGLLSGIAAGGAPRATIVLTGIVLIFVEAFSMGVGSYLSEHSIENFGRRRSSDKMPVVGGLIMMLSYIVAGLIPLSPYLVLDGPSALWWSIGASLIGLLVLGVVDGKMTRSKGLPNALRMLLLGGMAIGIGTLVGKLVTG